eukprot:GAFH01002210.1.p2 GENE.GAFH01002210.1~~GAFH01002210.1.p2  ORF type:complete len:387 (-),score=78.55 GAFH01002210.1:87-1130(-)
MPAEDRMGYRDPKHPLNRNIFFILLLHILPGLVSLPVYYYCAQFAHRIGAPGSFAALLLTVLWVMPFEMGVLIWVGKRTTYELRWRPKFFMFVPYWPRLDDVDAPKQPHVDPPKFTTATPSEAARQARRRRPARSEDSSEPQEIAVAPAPVAAPKKAPLSPASQMMQYVRRLLHPQNGAFGGNFMWALSFLLFVSWFEDIYLHKWWPALYTDILAYWPWAPAAYHQEIFDKYTTSGLVIFLYFGLSLVIGISRAVVEETYFRGLLLPALKLHPRLTGKDGKRAYIVHNLIYCGSQLLVPQHFVTRVAGLWPVMKMVQQMEDMSLSLVVSLCLSVLGVVAEYLRLRSS